MAVYCVPRTDEALLDDIGDARHVLLIGCPSCANIGYSIHRQEDVPIIKFSLTGVKPVCVRNEARRISHLLSQKGASVDLLALNAPGAVCALDEPTRKKVSKRGRDSDAVITLSCESGRENVKGILPGKTVVCAMNAKGVLRGILKKKLASIYIDWQTINVLRFKFEEPFS